MPVLEVRGSDRIYPTRTTLNRLRQRAAQQGEVVTNIRTDEELLDALIKTIPEDKLDEALHRMRTLAALPVEEREAYARSQGWQK